MCSSPLPRARPCPAFSLPATDLTPACPCPAPPYLCLGGAALASPCMGRGSSWPNCALRPTQLLRGWAGRRGLRIAVGGLLRSREGSGGETGTPPGQAALPPHPLLLWAFFVSVSKPLSWEAGTRPQGEAGSLEGGGGRGRERPGPGGGACPPAAPPLRFIPRRPLPLSPRGPVLWVLSV